jgi:hypothetical protein
LQEAYQRLSSNQYLIGLILGHEPNVRLYWAPDRLASVCPAFIRRGLPHEGELPTLLSRISYPLASLYTIIDPTIDKYT